jgi:hypothetical protein
MTVEIAISVKEPAVGRIGAVAQTLETLGMDVSDVHEIIGVVTGRCEEKNLAGLRSHPDVFAVETSRNLRA